MASAARFAVAVMVASFAIETWAAKNHSAVVSLPQKRVEIIELTLSHRHQKIGEARKTSSEASQSEEQVKYEMHIKQPTKNGRDSRGGQKIKMFFETEDYSSSMAGNPSQGAGRPVPLSIRTSPDSFSQGGTGRDGHWERHDNLPNGDVRHSDSRRPTESAGGEYLANSNNFRRDDKNTEEINRQRSINQNRGYNIANNQYDETVPKGTPSVYHEEAHREPAFRHSTALHRNFENPIPPQSTRLYVQQPQNHNDGVRERSSSSSHDPVYNDRESSFVRGSEVRPETRPRAQESFPETEYRPIPSGERPQAREYPESASPDNNRQEWKQPDREPVYAIEESLEVSAPTTSTYGKESGGRSIRDNSYSGFPESHRSNTRTTPLPDSNRNGGILPESPCPNFFKYLKFEGNVWYGEIFVTTDEVLVGMRIDLTLDKAADVLTTWSAEVKSRDNTRFTILSLKKKLIPQTPETISIMVAYDEKEKPPNVKQILLNGRTICSARPKVEESPGYQFPSELSSHRKTTTTTTTERSPVYVRPPMYEQPSSTRRPIVNSQRPPLSTSYSTILNPVTYENEFNSNSNTVTKKPTRTSTPKPISNLLNTQDRPQASGPGVSRPQGGNFNVMNVGSSKPIDKPKRSIQCGVPAVQPKPLITNGQNTVKGQWPWHIALYKNVGPNLKYLCGGNLISELHVVTAAHCVMMEYSSRPVDPSVLLVYLGKFKLSMWAEHGVEAREVARVSIHPDYNATSFHSDIAVVTLSQKVTYNDIIRPVCLWDKDTRIEEIAGREGTVVGWGLDETERLTNQLKMAKMPVVKQSDCLWSYPQFYPKFTSNSTYCAGYRNGTGACNGDSGGGMVFPYKINNDITWYLRGIVSISPSVKDTRICDLNHYVVFTDVARFLPWLSSVMSRDKTE